MRKHRLPFRDDMVRAIREDRKTVTRRASDRFASWAPGDLVDVCEGLRVHEPHHRDENFGEHEPWGRVAYTADGFVHPTWDWTWQVSRLAPRYCPADLVRTRLEVVSVTPEPGWEVEHTKEGDRLIRIVPRLDEEEARREGFADRGDFFDAWHAINGTDLVDTIYRVEFRRVEVARG